MNNRPALQRPHPRKKNTVQDTTVIGVEDSTDSSPNDHPGAIWLSLRLVEMSEPKEGASQEHEATVRGLLHCDTSSSDNSNPYGWAEGADYSTDVSSRKRKKEDHRKRTIASKNNKRRRTNPRPLAREMGVA